jgi:hypothetical protein
MKIHIVKIFAKINNNSITIYGGRLYTIIKRLSGLSAASFITAGGAEAAARVLRFPLLSRRFSAEYHCSTQSQVFKTIQLFN